MEERYKRNIPALSPEEQTQLAEKKVLVCGCGGLGGYVVENLLRLGVGVITVVDGDRFEESNLNRQLLSEAGTLGTPKVFAAVKRAESIAPKAGLNPICAFLTQENADELIKGHDLAIDALDSPAARLVLESACAKHDIPLIHGAVRGWSFQSAVIPAGSFLLRSLYGESEEDTSAENKSCLAMTCQCCAAVETAEALKLRCNRESSLWVRILLFDLLTMEQRIIEL